MDGGGGDGGGGGGGASAAWRDPVGRTGALGGRAWGLGLATPPAVALPVLAVPGIAAPLSDTATALGGGFACVWMGAGGGFETGFLGNGVVLSNPKEPRG